MGAYEDLRQAALIEAALALVTESQATPRACTWHRTATSLLRSRRILELRGAGVWLEFTSSEIAADERAATLAPRGDCIHSPHLVGASFGRVELLSLLTTLVTDLQLRRTP